MNKKIFLVVFSFIFILTLTAIGCSAPSPTTPETTPTPAVTAPATSAPSGEVYELSVAYGDNKTEFSDAELEGPDTWSSELEKASNGRLKVTTFYYAGQLIADAEIYDAAARGTVDIAINTVAQTPNRWVVMDLLSITPLGSPCKYQSKAYREVFYQYQDVFDQQFNDTKILAIHGTIPDPPGLPIGSVKKELKSLDDLKGFKLCGPGTYNMNLMAALGAAPTMIPPPEQYTALQKGILDGTILDPIFYDMLNFKELIKYQTSNLSLGGSPWFMVMNKDKFNSLPQDLQKVLVDIAPVLGDKRDSMGFTLKDNMVKNAVENYGLQLVEIPADEIAKMKEIEKPIMEAQVAEYAKTLPQAAEILDAYKAARAKFSQ